MADINEALGIGENARCSNENSAFEESAFKWFSGRATRSDWWMCRFIAALPLFFLFGMPLCFLLCRDSYGVTWAEKVTLISVVSFLGWAISIFFVSIDVRRLHDRNMSGWWVLASYLLSFVPVLGWAVGVFFFINLGCLDGTIGPNHYGEDPKGRKGDGSANAIPMQDSVEVRLQRIKELCDKGILSAEEYEEQRKKIIAEL